MLNLTKQERAVIIFLASSGLLGIGIVSYKNLTRQPKIEVVSNRQIDEEAAAGKIININTAAKYELMKLKGIGPVLAGAIVEYRSSRGAFKDKEELKNIKGLGRAKYEAIKEYIKVE